MSISKYSFILLLLAAAAFCAEEHEDDDELYGLVDIKSKPPKASVLIGGKEMGIVTPIELLMLGEVKIGLRKEGYNAWDTTLHIEPKSNIKLRVVMEEIGFDKVWSTNDVVKDEAVKEAVAEASVKEDASSGGGLTGKGIFRIAVFGLAATGAGLGGWQHIEAKSKSKKARELRTKAINLEGSPEYSDAYNRYDKELKSSDTSKNLRTGFYIGAGVFGLAGIVSFFF